MATATAKQDRIGARVPREVYDTLRRAAELTGATVNQFLVQSALKQAQAVIEREEAIRLSPRDWNWLLDLMENPPAPNARLKTAMKKYNKAKRGDAGTAFNLTMCNAWLGVRVIRHFFSVLNLHQLRSASFCWLTTGASTVRSINRVRSARWPRMSGSRCPGSFEGRAS